MKQSIEVGLKTSQGQFNDFHRCSKCKWGFFVNALARGGKVQCPECGEVQNRNK